MNDSEEHDCEEEESRASYRSPTVVSRMLMGFKASLIVVFLLPFIVFLIPMWFVYSWSERLAGRPAPEPPWVEFWPKAKPAPGRNRRQTAEMALGEVAVPPRPVAQSEEMAPMVLAEGMAVPPWFLGRTALVTGGARRVGAAICRDLAAGGMKVAVAYHRSREEAEALVREIEAAGGRAKAFSADLRNPAYTATLLNDVEATLGPVVLLVNNAGLMLPTREGSWEGIETILRVNLHAPLWLAMESAGRMQRRGGSGLIVNIGDIWGERPLKGFAAYSASKAGLLMASRTLAREVAPEVRVNVIAPGAILPPEDPGDGEAYQQLLSRTPLAPLAHPQAVVQALRYLMGAEYVTGEVLHVDGGRLVVS